jgi:hypothetical protein
MQSLNWSILQLGNNCGVSSAWSTITETCGRRDPKVLAPCLTAMTSAKVKWSWYPIHANCFEITKKKIRETLLAYPDFSKPFENHTDASKVQLGACISITGWKTHCILLSNHPIQDNKPWQPAAADRNPLPDPSKKDPVKVMCSVVVMVSFCEIETVQKW